jgi:hypothetical protein
MGKRILGGGASFRLSRRLRDFMMDDEGESRVKASYRENYPRLAAIQKKYDPTNFFRCESEH